MEGFVIKQAGYNDAERFHAVMKAAYDSIDDKELYICDEYDYVKGIINNKDNGFGIMCCSKGHSSSYIPVGVLLVAFPRLSPDNLMYDVKDADVTKLQVTDDVLKRTAHIESAAVLKEYRGNGLQNMMIAHACEYIRTYYPDIRYVMATVSPRNIPSVRSFQKNGFETIITKDKYGGKIRSIILKDML